MPDIEMSMLENALDFIDDAVTQLQDLNPSPRAIKYAMLHLSSGLELLFKQRLYDEHWSLIFRKPEEAEKRFLQTGEFNSVTSDEAVTRLTKICGIDLNPHKALIKSFRDQRNRIEHYHVSLTKDAAVSQMVKVWSFMLDFCQNELGVSDEPMFDDIKTKMIAHQDFVSHRLQETAAKIKELERNHYILPCPHCQQMRLPLMEEESSCIFCGTHFLADELESQWIDSFGAQYAAHSTEYGYPEAFVCDSCDMESAYLLMFDYDTRLLCFHCGEHRDGSRMERCDECGRYFEGDGEIPVCAECWDYKVSRDD